MQRLKYIFNEVLVGLWRNVTMTVAMIITMSVSLTMLGASVLLYMQVNQMKDFYYGEIEVSIFLDEKITDGQNATIAQTIDQSPLVLSKTFESRSRPSRSSRSCGRTRPTSSTRSDRRACPPRTA